MSPEENTSPKLKPLILQSPEQAKFLWDKISGFSWFLDDFEKANPITFVNTLISPSAIIYEVPGKALFYLTNCIPNFMADVNVAIWDKDIMGPTALELGREGIRLAFEFYQFQRLNGTIFRRNRLAFQYAKRLGFRAEGCRRDFRWHNGKLEDVLILGLLRKEKKKWQVATKQSKRFPQKTSKL